MPFLLSFPRILKMHCSSLFLIGFASLGISRANLNGNDSSFSDCVNDADNRQCWSGPWGDFNITTDYYENTPDTGVIVEVSYSNFHQLIVSIGSLLTMSPFLLTEWKKKCMSTIIHFLALQSRQIGVILSSCM